MNIRQAILAAANQIERHPETFDFMSTRMPSCGTPGCALGWIGAFLAVKPEWHESHLQLTGEIIGIGSSEFYRRMSNISLHWTGDAQICADTLRKYADKYHPNLGTDIPKQGIPDSVRSIFREKALEEN